VWRAAAGGNCGEIVDRGGGEGGGHVFEVPAADAGKPVSFVVTIRPAKAGG
jgi:hypothetical protein